jgi:phage-related protein
MPGELRDKIKLWEILNKILKNNGFIDSDAILSQLTSLKQQINIVLQDVLGLEHEIDNVHNYDDTDIKSKFQNLTNSVATQITQIQDSVGAIQDDVNSLSTRLTGISSTSTQFCRSEQCKGFANSIIHRGFWISCSITSCSINFEHSRW